MPLSDYSKAFLLEIEKSVERETHLINLLSDNLLYLTRVEEGRALTSKEAPNAQQVRTYVRTCVLTCTRTYVLICALS